MRTSLRRATFATLIGLLSVTGMRVGEGIALDRNDIDLNAGHLLVHDTKFGKTRELVLHPSTVDALRRYLRLGNRLAPAEATLAVFVSTAGTRLIDCNIQLDLSSSGPPRTSGGANCACVVRDTWDHVRPSMRKDDRFYAAARPCRISTAPNQANRTPVETPSTLQPVLTLVANGATATVTASTSWIAAAM
jgi:integrase